MKSSEEWSLAFDLLWNNITSNQAPGLERYEKSVFLTQAENDLAKEYFSPTHNAAGEGFDDSIRRQADFRSLLVSTTLPELTFAAGSQIPFRADRSSTKYFEYPYNALFIINEEVSLSIGGVTRFCTVVPISYDEYARLMMRPYKYPPKDMLWRLLTNNVVEYNESTGEPLATHSLIELVGKFISGCSVVYKMHYVRRPDPIVLGDMPDGLSVDGVSHDSPCTLPEHLHDEILRRAVQLAKISWSDGSAITRTE